WHVAMQQHGFGRIYAAKAGDVARRSARLDLICVLTWYVTVVAWSDSWMEGIARSFRKAGLPIFDLLSRGAWRGIQIVLLAISLDATRPGALYRRLFGSRRGILLFAGLAALYGVGAYFLYSSGYRLIGADANRTMQVIGSIALTSLLLHFYVDSFIWKVRSKEVRAALAIRDGEPSAVAVQPISPKALQVRDAVHAVAYFGIPILLLAVIGAGR